MTPSKSVSTIFVLFALLCAPVGPVVGDLHGLTAADKAHAEAKALEAKFKFKAEDYSGAASLFLQAFAASHAPALLYNAARAFEEAGKLKQARAAFEQYLSLSNVPAAGRSDAKRKIASINRRIAVGDAAKRQGKADKAAADKTAADKAAADKTAADRARPKTTRTVAPSGPAAQLVRPAEPRSSTVTWSLIGGGGTTALLGVLLMGTGADQRTTANTSTDWTAANARPNYLAASDAAASTWGSGLVLALAGVGVATWGVLRWRADARPRQRSVDSQLSVTPSLLRDVGADQSAPGFVLGGHF